MYRFIELLVCVFVLNFFKRFPYSETEQEKGMGGGRKKIREKEMATDERGDK